MQYLPGVASAGSAAGQGQADILPVTPGTSLCAGLGAAAEAIDYIHVQGESSTAMSTLATSCSSSWHALRAFTEWTRAGLVDNAPPTQHSDDRAGWSWAPPEYMRL